MTRLSEYVISVFILATLLTAAIIATTQIPVALRNNPITIINFSYPASSNMCPGDILPIQFTFKIEGPSVVQGYTSVIDDAHNTMRGTEQGFPPRPHPETIVLRQTTNWVIPDLPPGSYHRVTAMESVTFDSEIVLFSIPFTVSPLCTAE